MPGRAHQDDYLVGTFQCLVYDRSMAQVRRLEATNEDQTVEILMAIGGELGVRHAGSVADDRGALSFVRKLPALGNAAFSPDDVSYQPRAVQDTALL